MIIYTILDLEQFIGTKIDWVSGKSFDDVIKRKSGIPNLPQPTVNTQANVQNVDPTTNLTSTETALLSPEEQVIRQRLRRTT